MSSDADFDDLVDKLGGFGKYQKRLLYLLLGPLFFIMPFPLLHQVKIPFIKIGCINYYICQLLYHHALPSPLPG